MRRAPLRPRASVPVPRRADLPSPLPPRLVQNLPVRLRLALPRIERRLLRPGGRVLPAPLVHVVEKLPAPGRERVQHRPPVARDLEPRHPAHQGRHRGIADALQSGPELVAVIGADQELRAFHRAVNSALRHFPSRPRVMLAITACVWSCGSRLRLARWRKVAAVMPSAGTRRAAGRSPGRRSGSGAVPSR